MKAIAVVISAVLVVGCGGVEGDLYVQADHGATPIAKHSLRLISADAIRRVDSLCLTGKSADSVLQRRSYLATSAMGTAYGRGDEAGRSRAERRRQAIDDSLKGIDLWRLERSEEILQGAAVASTTTDFAGHYHMSARPGTYYVVAAIDNGTWTSVNGQRTSVPFVGSVKADLSDKSSSWLGCGMIMNGRSYNVVEVDPRGIRD